MRTRHRCEKPEFPTRRLPVPPKQYGFGARCGSGETARVFRNKVRAASCFGTGPVTFAAAAPRVERAPPPGHSRAAPRASPVATSASCGFELPRRESRDVRRSRYVRGSTRAECPPPTTTWSARAIPFVALRRGPRRAHRRRRAPSPPPITRHSPRVPDRFPLRGVASSPASQPRSARSAPRPRPSISTCSCAGCRAKTRIRFTDCS